MEKIYKSLKKNKMLLMIILIGAILRFCRLSDIPYGFDGDEAAFGYYGYSLLKNLTDEFGNKLPLYFPSIGDYKYPVYAYLTTLPVAVFGLSVFSTRFISAFSGTILVAVIYLLAALLFKPKPIKYVAAFLTAISPYGIIFSRGAYESNLATLWVSLGILMIVFFSELKKSKFLFFSFIFFILSTFTYSATRIFIPTLVVGYGLVIVKNTNFKLREKRNYLFFCVILILTISIAFIDQRSRARAADVSIINNYKISEDVRDAIWEDGISQSGNIFITRVFHNKVIAHSRYFLEGYLNHFDSNYLFTTSNPQMFKYSVPGMGLFYYFEMVTIVLGIVALSKYLSRKITYILVMWIILAPIPSALTVETPNPIRTLIGLPALIILSSLGAVYFIELFRNKLSKAMATVVLGFIVVLNFLYFQHQYFIHDKFHRPWYTDGGMKEMILSVNKYEGSFEKIAIANDPYIFFLFYNKVHPNDFISKSKIDEIRVGKWEYVDEFEKIVFKMPFICPKIGRTDVLYVCTGTEVPLNGEVLEVVRFSDGVPAYTLIRFVPYSARKNEALPEGLNYMVETDLSFDEGLLPIKGGRYW